MSGTDARADFEALSRALRRIPEGRTLDTVTAEEWRAATQDERRRFLQDWARRGVVSFVCLNCSFPSAHGVAFCEACRP